MCSQKIFHSFYVELKRATDLFLTGRTADFFAFFFCIQIEEVVYRGWLGCICF